jgi:hypothetical protein
MVSTDGITWTVGALTRSANWSGLAWNGLTLIAVADSGDIVTSPDGLTWTSRVGNIGFQQNDVAWGNGLFVIVGNGNRTKTSPDGITWTFRSYTNLGIDWKAITYAGTQFARAGYLASGGGWVSVSTDGLTWADTNVAGNLNCIAYIPGYIVALGLRSDWQYSNNNGATWNYIAPQVTSGPTFQGIVGATTRFIAVGPSSVSWTIT